MNEFDRLPFAPAELLARRDAVVATMEARDIDVLALCDTANMFYLTGFGSLAYGGTVLLLDRKGRGRWVMRQTELSNVRYLKDQLWADEGVGVVDGQDFGAVLMNTVREFAGDRVSLGVEFAGVLPSLRAFAGLKAPDGVSVVDASGIVEHLRRIKSPAEIELMRRGGRIVAEACRAGFEALHEGMTDTELAAVVTDSLLRQGSDRVAQMPNVCAGPRTSRAHVTWCGAPIARGEVVNIEPAASVWNYHVPVYRIYSIGEPDPEIRKMFDACRTALDAGYAAIRPGMSSHDAARVIEGSLEGSGYGEFKVTRPAYSIGASFPPGWGEDQVMAIRSGLNAPLEPGMCFHVVPCLYRDGYGCVAASMPSLLTDNGLEPLCGDEVVLGIK